MTNRSEAAETAAAVAALFESIMHRPIKSDDDNSLFDFAPSSIELNNFSILSLCAIALWLEFDAAAIVVVLAAAVAFATETLALPIDDGAKLP